MSAGLGRNHLDCRIAQVINGQIRTGPCEGTEESQGNCFPSPFVAV
jgi:hypothetical protein